MRPVIRMHAYDYDRSAAHGAQWQELEIILCWLLKHGNMRERTERVAHASLRPAETFMRVCPRPMEAVCFRVRKGANNHQLIVAGVQRFFRYAYADRRAKSYVYYINIRKQYLAYFSYPETVTCMRV